MTGADLNLLIQDLGSSARQYFTRMPLGRCVLCRIRLC